nr:hypothetical protein [Tanacetum cinerariifolium]
MNSRDNVSKTDDKIDKLADQISNLVEIINKQVITPAKAVEKTCVTCGGAHAYYDCIATDSNQPSVCAATGSYNQVSPPNRASHQIPPPDFAPVQNNPKRCFDEFSNHMKSNEIMIKSMQNQINVLRGDFNKQEENLRRNLNNDMRSILRSFFQNQPLTLGTLPSNTVSNLKGEMKVVTTRSGLAYEGPSIPTNSPLETVDEQNTEEITDKEHSNYPGRASINLTPLSIWKKLLLPELTPTQMTLKLADRSITRSKGVAEDVFIKVEKFHFPTDFVVVDFEADLRVPLILRRSFLRTDRALIDVYGEEITLRYNSKSSNPTLVSDPLISENDFCKEPIVKSSSPTLTPFEENPFQLPPMDLKLAEETKAKSFIEEPPELELKELPSHLEYAFLDDSNKLPVIIAKDLKDVKKEALINVLKSHK